MRSQNKASRPSLSTQIPRPMHTDDNSPDGVDTSLSTIL